MTRFTKTLKATTLAFAATTMVATSVMATEGLVMNGVGARNKALAGAGVADGNDATAIALNPAGLVNSPNQLSMSFSAFIPITEFKNAPTRFNSFESDSSDATFFPIPNIAYTHRVDANTVFGLSMYAVGGNGIVF